MRRRVLLQTYLQFVEISPTKRLLLRRHWTECLVDRVMVDRVMAWWLSGQPRPRQMHALHHCWYCGVRPGAWDPRLVSDHIFPKRYTTTPLVPACLRCNSSKHDRSPLQWRGEGWPFWFLSVGLAPSPLGYALQEDTLHFQGLFARYLNGQLP
jgi:hypothetical protein